MSWLPWLKWPSWLMRFLYPSKSTNRRLLLQIRRDLAFVVKYAISSSLTQDESIRLRDRFNVKNVYESDWSYTHDKKSIHVCFKDPSGNLEHKHYDQILHEAIHLLAYIVHINFGHDVVFWDINHRLTQANNLSECDKLKEVRRIISARRIQRVWKRCISDPKNPICQRRLLYEWHGLQAYKEFH